MDKKVLNDVLARKFLLGQLSPEEQGSIEELAFDDPDSFAYLQAAQDELLDDFVYDELSLEEKKRFKEHFLVQPGRREDLRIARALRQSLANEDQTIVHVPDKGVRPKVGFFDWFRQQSPTRAVVTTALILAAAVGLLLVLRPFRRSDTPPLEAKQTPAPTLPTPSSSPSSTLVHTTPSPAPKDDQRNAPPAPRIPTGPVFAVVLEPGAPNRSPDTEKTFSLPPGPTSFELPLIDETPYQSYQAVLQINGKTIRRWTNLRPQELQTGKGVNVSVPAGFLKKSQRYHITLEGIPVRGSIQLVHDYYFHVV